MHNLVCADFHTNPLIIDGVCVVEMFQDNKVLSGEIVMKQNSLLIILDGTLTLTSPEGKEFILYTKEMAILPMMSNFKIKKTLNFQGQFKGLFFYLDSEYLDRYILCYDLKIPKHIVDYDNLNKVCSNQNIYNYASATSGLFDFQPDRLDYIQCIFFSIMFEMEQHYGEFFKRILALRSPGLCDLKVFMEYNYMKNCTIGTFASMSGRSLSVFKRDFDKEFHMTPRKWINEKKLELAHEYLLIGKMSISEVSDRAGFSSVQYFCTCFKQKYNITPGML